MLSLGAHSIDLWAMLSLGAHGIALCAMLSEEWKLSMQTTQELAARISLISESSTMKVSADADRLRREGADVVDFGAGEPDFPTPDNIKRAAIDAIDHNFTKYTNAAGVMELKQAICERHKSDYGTSYAPNECVVT